MAMLISLTVAIISQSVCLSNHQVVSLKHKQFQIFNFTSVNLGGMWVLWICTELEHFCLFFCRLALFLFSHLWKSDILGIALKQIMLVLSFQELELYWFFFQTTSFGRPITKEIFVVFPACCHFPTLISDWYFSEACYYIQIFLMSIRLSFTKYVSHIR